MVVLLWSGNSQCAKECVTNYVHKFCIREVNYFHVKAQCAECLLVFVNIFCSSVLWLTCSPVPWWVAEAAQGRVEVRKPCAHQALSLSLSLSLPVPLLREVAGTWRTALLSKLWWEQFWDSVIQYITNKLLCQCKPLRVN